MNTTSGTTFKQAWPVMACIGTGQIFGWGSTYYLPAAIAKYIHQDMGWSNAVIMGGISCSLLIAGLLAPRVGRAIDRLGGNTLMAYSALLFALGLCILAAAHNLVLYYAGWVVIGLGMSCGLFDAAFATAGRILGSGARQAITGITFLSSFSSTAVWPLATWISEYSSWRTACLVLAGVQLIGAFPMYRFLVPSPPDIVAAKQAKTTGQQPAHQPFVFAQSPWKDVRFVLVVSVVALTTFSIASLMVQFLDFLRAIELSSGAAVAVAMWYGATQAIIRLAELVFSRYLNPLWISRISIALLLGAFTVFGLLGAPYAALGVMLCGAGNGLLSIVRGSLMLSTFGPLGYASRMGLLSRPTLVAQALAPLAGGFMLAHFGPMSLLGVLAVCALCSMVMALMLGYVKPPAVSRPQRGSPEKNTPPC